MMPERRKLVPPYIPLRPFGTSIVVGNDFLGPRPQALFRCRFAAESGGSGILAPLQGAGHLLAWNPGVSLRSTPGYGLASLAGCVGGLGRHAMGSRFWHPLGVLNVSRLGGRGYRCARPPATVWHPFGVRWWFGASRDGEQILAPIRGAERFASRGPGVSLRSTPGYGLASLAGCVGDWMASLAGREN
jgi:hypothetical protein